MRSFSTKAYSVLVGSGAGAGTFIITRNADNACTLRNVCSEGQAYYAELRRLYKNSRTAFDQYLANHETFETE